MITSAENSRDMVYLRSQESVGAGLFCPLVETPGHLCRPGRPAQPGLLLKWRCGLGTTKTKNAFIHKHNIIIKN